MIDNRTRVDANDQEHIKYKNLFVERMTSDKTGMSLYLFQCLTVPWRRETPESRTLSFLYKFWSLVSAVISFDTISVCENKASFVC